MIYPTVSIVIPTYNEENNIRKCLDSIFSQKYPKSKLEIIVVDNYSTDNTLKIVNTYKVKVILNKVKHGEISKMIGFRKAKSEYVLYLDADIVLRGKDWITKMLQPLQENSEVVGSFTRYYSNKNSSGIERYLNFDPLQRDGIYQYFSPKIEDVVVKKVKKYYLCEYKQNKIPPAGLCVYRKQKLLKLVSEYDMFLELDFLVLLVKSGLNNFAYVPDAGLYHTHVKSFLHLLHKRKYNLQKVYLGRKKRLYKWFDLSTSKGLIKVAFWIVYANSIIPSVFVGLFKTIKYRDFSGMYEPLINLFLTDYLLILTILSAQGRFLIKNGKVNS